MVRKKDTLGKLKASGGAVIVLVLLLVFLQVVLYGQGPLIALGNSIGALLGGAVFFAGFKVFDEISERI